MSIDKKDTDPFINPIDPDDVVENPGLINFPHHVGSAVIKPEDKGKIKGRAMAAMKDQTSREMKQLYEQMQVLVQQAGQIKKRVEVSEKIYHSQINLEPVIGHTYYLYGRGGQDTVLSMISPEEWGDSMPFKKYLATVILLSDHTWEIIDRKD